jgi:hypothetical protein
MGWKASSHAEAATVMVKLARSGISVLNELDVHAERHSAGNDCNFKVDNPAATLAAQVSTDAVSFDTEEDSAKAVMDSVALPQNVGATAVADFCGPGSPVDY